ncbi:hypothetical protein [Nocardioides ungokensis]|uniref:hypothetical protein n=1 Tax=Nocardioides ungokensis TaxID=1643322 RepID=UPI0015DFD6EC|nr:hypothetical protein [Nocardioides ungokensis]
MGTRTKAFGAMLAGWVSAVLGFLWFGSDPLAGLTVAVSGAVLFGWAAHRLVMNP